jgi:hypothetical protein
MVDCQKSLELIDMHIRVALIEFLYSSEDSGGEADFIAMLKF